MYQVMYWADGRGPFASWVKPTVGCQGRHDFTQTYKQPRQAIIAAAEHIEELPDRRYPLGVLDVDTEKIVAVVIGTNYDFKPGPSLAADDAAAAVDKAMREAPVLTYLEALKEEFRFDEVVYEVIVV